MQLISRLAVTFLLNAIWQVPLIAATAWICSRITRNVASRHVHQLWASALVVSLLLPLASAVKSGFATGQGPSGIAATGDGSARQGVLSMDQPTSPPKVISLAPIWIEALAVAYLLFLLLRGGWIVQTLRRTQKIWAVGQTVGPSSPVMKILDHYGSFFGIPAVSILRSPLVRSPLTLGVWKHKILLPETVLQMASDEDWTVIVSHEMAHIHRHDFIKNLIYEFLSWPIAFHPAAALIKKQIARTRELACDEMAAERLEQPDSYARSLVAIAGITSAMPVASVSHYSLGVLDENLLEERIMKLLQTHRLSPRRSRSLLTVAFAILVISSLSIAAFALPVAEKPAATNSRPANAGPGQNSKIFNVGDDGVTSPRPISTPDPEYPKVARDAGNQGQVTIAIVVGPDGKVHDLQVVSSPSKDFDGPAADAVRGWVFKPAMKDGEPVTVKLKVTVAFTLGNNEDKKLLSKHGQQD